MNQSHFKIIKIIYLALLASVAASGVMILLNASPHFETPKMVAQNFGQFQPHFITSSIFKWNKRLFVQVLDLYEIDPTAFTCKKFLIDKRIARSIFATPDEKHLFLFHWEDRVATIKHLTASKTEEVKLKDGIYGSLCGDNNHLIFLTDSDLQIWDLNSSTQVKPRVIPTKVGCSSLSPVLKGDWLYIAHDNGEWGGKFSKTNIKTGESKILLEKSVRDIKFDSKGNMWTVSSRAMWDGGDVRLWDNDKPTLISSNDGQRYRHTGKPDTYRTKETFNWNYPPTCFRSLLVDESEYPVLVTESEGLFRYDGHEWKRLYPGIFGLESFDKAIMLNDDSIFIAGHLNYGTTMMIYEISKNQYKLLHCDRTEELKMQHKMLEQQYGIRFDKK